MRDRQRPTPSLASCADLSTPSQTRECASAVPRNTAGCVAPRAGEAATTTAAAATDTPESAATPVRAAGAAAFALIVALLLATEYFEKKLRKSK